MRALGAAIIVAIFAAARIAAQERGLGTPLPSIELPAELSRVLRDYERAWQAHDPTALSELFADDGFVLTSGRAPVRGKAAIRAVYARAGGSLSLRALAFATAGDVGYIIGGFGPRPGGPDAGKFVLTLKRGSDRRWLIMSDMDNPNQERMDMGSDVQSCIILGWRGLRGLSSPGRPIT